MAGSRLVCCGVLAAVALAACGGSTPASGTATPRATAAALPQPRERCGDPRAPALALRFPARDGLSLDGAITGRGPVGVVLLHEYPGPMCGWWPYAVYLARHGVHALLFDFRCFGLSACPADGRGAPVDDVAGAVAALRAHGARTVALVGASLGGVVAVTAGAALRPAAIVDLSGERDLGGLLPGADLNAYAAAPRLRAPALFALARGDANVSVPAMRAVYRRAGSRMKRLIVLPAAEGHGWDMLIGARASWSALAGRVAAFVKAHA